MDGREETACRYCSACKAKQRLVIICKFLRKSSQSSSASSTLPSCLPLFNLDGGTIRSSCRSSRGKCLWARENGVVLAFVWRCLYKCRLDHERQIRGKCFDLPSHKCNDITIINCLAASVFCIGAQVVTDLFEEPI